MAKKKNRPKTLAEYDDDELQTLWDRPDEYAALSDSDLDLFLYYAIGVYGTTSRSELILKLIPLYGLFLQRVPTAQRLQNYCATRNQVQSGVLSANGLLPYLFADDDIGIVSSAALDFAVLHPLEGNDPLTGPKSLMALIENGGLSNGPAAIGGLVMLGDQTVMDLLQDIRHRLSNPAVETVTHCLSGFLFAAVFEFYLSWLEDLLEDYDETIFGTVAAALCNLVQRPAVPVVSSIERVFPGTPDNAVRVLESWPLAKYLRKLKPRLRAIAAREPEPKLIPLVLQAWSQK